MILMYLKRCWKRFDTFGRKFMVQASPILGSGENELKTLKDLEARRSERSPEKHG